MKLFMLATTKQLGPGTPSAGIVREESEARAFEAFCDNTCHPWVGKPQYFVWFDGSKPTINDFIIKEIGTDDRYPASFSDKIRAASLKDSPVYNKEEHACRLFLSDRIVIRVFSSGGIIARIIFATKLWLVGFLRSTATKLDKDTEG